MNVQNNAPKTLRQRLENTKRNHLNRVLEKLIIDYPMKDSRVANPEILERFRYSSDYVVINHIFSYYNENDIGTVHWYYVDEYKNRGERVFKKGRPVGSKNRYRPNYGSDSEAIDALQMLGDDYEETSLADEVKQIENTPMGSVMLEADAKKEIATLFSQFLERYSQDIDGIKSELNQKFVILTDGAKEAIAKYVESIKPNVIEIKRSELPNINMGVQHKNFEKLLKMCSAAQRSGHHLNVWIYGPAGTGKSTAAEKVAEALSLDYYTDGKMVDDTKVLGYKDAGGNYHTTNFRKAFEFGGVYLADEIDGSMPDALLALNGALANGHCAFPDKIVKRHPSFVFLAAANTTGTGGTVEYVGRFKQDAAFNDRFVFLDWPIDNALEEALVTNKDWLARVRHVRARCLASTIKGHLITPRASIYGEALLAAGLDQNEVEAMTLKKGLTDAQWRMIN